MAELKRFLRRVASTPFVWGRSDCILTAADWVREVTGADPARAYRGAYEDEAGARAIAKAAGGLELLIATSLRPLGYFPTDDPPKGAVGLIIVETPGGPDVGCAIRTGRRWAGKSGRGVWMGSGRLVSAWTR